MKKAFLKITGRVQGVFYRQSARETANSLKLNGWIKNLPDGSVEAAIEGPEEQIDAFITWSRQGPPGARVENVEISWSDCEVSYSESSGQKGLCIIG